MQESTPHPLIKPAKSVAAFLVLLGAMYMINVEVQSYLGRQAAEATGLPKHSLTEALALSAQQDKPVLAELSAVWCPACRKLDEKVFTNDKIKAVIEKHYIFTRVDYDTEEGQRFTARYQARGTPTLLVLNAQGDPLRRLKLSYDPEVFIEQL